VCACKSSQIGSPASTSATPATSANQARVPITPDAAPLTTLRCPSLANPRCGQLPRLRPAPSRRATYAIADWRCQRPHRSRSCWSSNPAVSITAVEVTAIAAMDQSTPTRPAVRFKAGSPDGGDSQPPRRAVLCRPAWHRDLGWAVFAQLLIEWGVGPVSGGVAPMGWGHDHPRPGVDEELAELGVAPRSCRATLAQIRITDSGR